jgi:hypothetical protein
MARRPCRWDRDWLPSGQFDVPFARASVDGGLFSTARMLGAMIYARSRYLMPELDSFALPASDRMAATKNHGGKYVESK